MVSKLEFLCDAIAEYVGSHDPQSPAYRARNPLALKEVKIVKEGERQFVKFGQLRTFRSWMHGYESALFDLRLKCSGKSSSGLTEYSSIKDLTDFYGMNGRTAENVAQFLSVAMGARVTPDAKLFIFLR